MELKQLKERMDHVTNDQKLISDIIARHTSIPTNEIDQLFLEMAFVRAEEALERGITDEVREFRLPPGLPINQLVFK